MLRTFFSNYGLAVAAHGIVSAVGTAASTCGWFIQAVIIKSVVSESVSLSFALLDLLDLVYLLLQDFSHVFVQTVTP